MTYVELVHHVAKKHKLDEGGVRKVADILMQEMMELLSSGDEVKLHHIGTLYPASYNARGGRLEFGTEGRGGVRRRLRFRPFESTNVLLTEKWNNYKEVMGLNDLGRDDDIAANCAD